MPCAIRLGGVGDKVNARAIATDERGIRDFCMIFREGKVGVNEAPTWIDGGIGPRRGISPSFGRLSVIRSDMRFKKLSAWARALVDWAKPKPWTAAPPPTTAPTTAPTTGQANEAFVRLMIPRAWFTKKGPGILDRTRRVFAAFTPEQKELAVRKGWIPRKWLRRRQT